MALLKSIGKNPGKEELEKVQKSPNYKNGAFQNLSETSLLGGPGNFFKILWKMLTKAANTRPPKPLPSVKTDLKNLPGGNRGLVWFGHSSYLLNIDGKHILIDPVFSGYASPFKMNSSKSLRRRQCIQC